MCINGVDIVAFLALPFNSIKKSDHKIRWIHPNLPLKTIAEAAPITPKKGLYTGASSDIFVCMCDHNLNRKSN